jgi:integrase/recombinase XerD
VHNFSQLVQDFLDYVMASGRVKSENTASWYKQHLVMFQRWCTQNDRDPLSPLTFTAFFAAQKRRDLKETTLLCYYRVLDRFGRWLKLMGLADRSPAEHLEKPRPPRRDIGTIRAVSDDDIAAIEEAACHPRDLALVRLLRQSGSRASELVRLTWGKLDLDKRKAVVTGRYEKTRVVFFRPSAAEALVVYRETVPHDADDPVFWNVNGKRPLSYWGLYQALKRLAKRAGVKGSFNPHGWRHSYGIKMTLNGCPTTVLQDLMGHSTPNVTKIYNMFNEAQLREAYRQYAPEALDRAERGQ